MINYGAISGAIFCWVIAILNICLAVKGRRSAKKHEQWLLMMIDQMEAQTNRMNLYGINAD
jgi:hypothetical protein